MTITGIWLIIGVVILAIGVGGTWVRKDSNLAKEAIIMEETTHE